MQKSHTALIAASILALGVLGYSLAPGSAKPLGNDDSPLQQASQNVADCGPLAIAGSEGCVRSQDTASVYGQLHNADGTTTVWSLTFSVEGDAQIKRYRDLLLTAEGRLEYETVIIVQTDPEGRRELREVREGDGSTVFREVRHSAAVEGVTTVEQMPLSGDPEEVIAVLQRAAATLQQALALAPSV